MNRRLFFSILFLSLLVNFTHSQERKDLGIQVGGTYYIGDFNLKAPLYRPSPALGVIYRYNFNEFYSIRLSANYGCIKGDYLANDQYLPNASGNFKKQLIELESPGFE